jgi:hydroxymethylglutaryl-CoA lyase
MRAVVARSVEIVEVSPRDGLQAEDVVVDTETKLALIERALSAGVRRIEVCSFVNPARVPQMPMPRRSSPGSPVEPGART